MTSIRHVKQEDATAWVQLRCALWPDAQQAEHDAEVQRFLAGVAREPLAVLVAEHIDSDRLVGFVELSIRAYAEGCNTDRVAYLEAWYVMPEFRHHGIARGLIVAAQDWAVGQGCTELASDADVSNDIAAVAHHRCGFVETAVIRCFRKQLP